MLNGLATGISVLRNLASRAIGRRSPTRGLGSHIEPDAEEVIRSEPGITAAQREALSLIGGARAIELARALSSTRLVSEDDARRLRECVAQQAGRLGKMLNSGPLESAKRPSTILLVDDEPNVLQVIALMLRRAGHTVYPCAGFEAAQQHLVKGIMPDLLITDVVLRESTGKRVATAVQQMSPGTRVIFISGYANVAVGGQPVLQKPFSPNELVTLVDKVLSSSTSTGAQESFAASRKKLH